MPVLINFKICDNAKECGGIAICPTRALSWDEIKNKILIDNSKCNSCCLCEKECPVEAIKVAKNEKEYQKIKKEIDKDPRKTNDLFIDRYGATPIQSVFLVSQGNFDKEIAKSSKFTVVELFNSDSIKCLLSSIPIKELFRDINIRYRKTRIEDNLLLKKYNLKKLPSLLFFSEGALIGKIEGYYDIDQQEEIKGKINKIISSLK